MKVAAATAIANTIAEDELHEEYIIPSVFNHSVARTVAAAVIAQAQKDGLARIDVPDRL